MFSSFEQTYFCYLISLLCVPVLISRISCICCKKQHAAIDIYYFQKAIRTILSLFFFLLNGYIFDTLAW